MPRPSEDDLSTGRKGNRCDVRHRELPPPPASWPATNRASGNPQTTSQIGIANPLDRNTSTSPAALPIAALPCTGFDEDLEVLLPGRGGNFFVRIAGRELAASNSVAVLIHGGGFTGMSWAPAAALMKRDCCVLAPDLRGHGLTTSTSPVGGLDDDLNNPSDDGHDDLMSLDSLAEDVASLLVEIFSSGLLLRTQPRPRQQKPSPEAEDGRNGSAALACCARDSEATLRRGAAGVAEASVSKVEVRVSQVMVAEDGDDTAATGSGDASLATREAALHRGAEKASAAATAAAEAEAEAAGTKVGVHQPQGLVAQEGDDEVATGSGGGSRAIRARGSGEGVGATRLIESPGNVPKEGVGDSRRGVGGGGGSSCEGHSGSKNGEGSGVTRLVECSSRVTKEGADGDGSGDNCDGGSDREIPAGAAGDGAGKANPVAPGSASGEEQVGAACLRLLLVGHSLGGSIAVRMAGAAEEFKRRCGGAAEIAGVVTVDVVEGTALAALDDMPKILRKIPHSFPSMEAAVLWHSKTGAVRNAASASIVVPSRLKPDATGRLVWRTDLRATERHWRGWFEGMSKAFLALPIPKLLIVAGMDRLDTDLTAAHMQGKFQLKLVYGCGHSVQEDQPHETASSIMNFAVRNSVFRIRKGDASRGRNGEEEELRRKLARARGQTSHNTKR